MATRALRSPYAVTFSVWRALFLREAASRLARDPISWFRVLAEPVGHILLLMALFVSGFRQKVIAGGDTSVFIMLGVLIFFMPRNMMNRSLAVVEQSDALYAYRQVQPVDTVIARVMLEALLAVMVFALAWTGAALYGLPVQVVDPLLAIAAALAMWLAGLGLALVCSALSGVSGPGGNLVRTIRAPLYLFSAVMYPSYALPAHARELLLWNPFVHGVESFRLAFMQGYIVPQGLDLGYLARFAVVMIFFGLALHVRYQDVLRSK
jgi:capsular polysaccharide transport system permease protein